MNFLQCFRTFWLIAIDDASFIDDESWPLINELLHVKSIMFVMTLSKQNQLSSVGYEATNQANIHTTKLPIIDNWYVCGLACQILEVFAIPAELEK